MSILGYFSKRSPATCMPRREGADPVTGMRYEGAVLTGKLTVAQGIACDARESKVRTDAPVEPRLQDYDPVLRNHLRLEKR